MYGAAHIGRADRESGLFVLLDYVIMNKKNEGVTMRRFWMLVLVLCLLNMTALAENSLANRAVELAAA